MRIVCAVALAALASSVAAADETTTSSLAPGGPRLGLLSLRLTANRPGITFHRICAGDSEPVLAPLCEAPCTIDLFPGTHELGLSADGEVAADTVPVIVALSSHELVGIYKDRFLVRAGGWVLMAASVVTVIAGVAVGSGETDFGCGSGGSLPGPCVITYGENEVLPWTSTFGALGFSILTLPPK